MTQLQDLDFLLPAPPANWDKSNDFKLYKKLSAFTPIQLEAVGSQILARANRITSKRSLEEDIVLQQALMEATNDDLSNEDDEPETPALLRSNPSNWKDQDHYAVLGLSKLRYKANDDDIKRAYRRKVLLHHPDKKKSKSGKAEDDSFFKCIQKAWEVISDSKKRREWDSCDPEFDEEIPSAKAKGDFFEIYTPVFEKESRFSKSKQPVPSFGDVDSSRDDVELFYDFWFNFDSWRTFERLDEEDPDSAESREEKRWIDRKNKSARQKLKKEDIARLNKLVEQAFTLDPRIKRIKEDEKKAREAKKNEKYAVQRAAEAESKRLQEEAAIAKALADEEEKQKAAAEKKEREAAKNANRKEKKAIKRILKDFNNFLPEKCSLDVIEYQLSKADEIFNYYGTAELEAFRIKLENAIPSGSEHLGIIFDEEHMIVQELVVSKKDTATNVSETVKATEKKDDVKVTWSPKETSTLIKAVKVFPGGTIERWNKIAEYVNEHGGDDNETEAAKKSRNRTAKECIAFSKQVQHAVAADRAKIQASSQKPVGKVDLKDEPTARTHIAGETATGLNETPAPTMLVPNNPNWTSEQQIALEAALRQFPAQAFSANPSKRWEAIAEVVPTKNKKDIKNRVKELAEFAKTSKKK